jgi:hypothetical protein
MMTFTWVLVLALVLFGVIVTLALHQRRDVKAGFKIPLATFFFEASGEGKSPAAGKPEVDKVGTGST